MTKKLKKTTAFLSAVAMVMAMLLYFPSGMFSNIDWGLKASAEGETQTENWIDSAATEFAGGTGTEGDPYQIATAEQLAYLAQQVNTGTDYSGVFFKLTADINLGDKEWTPIGNQSYPFVGTFDGDGHKITNLKIESTGDYVGLFGCNYGKISNVGIEGGSVTGKDSVGGVCGDNGGPISNCYNTGEVTGENSVGGVCGSSSYVTISNCYNTGDVSGSDKVGGVYGSNNYGRISNCYNTGDVSGSDMVGGVCGYNRGPIENCYNTGSVTGGSNVGGVCGYFDGGTISNCYYLEGTSSTGIGSGSDSDGPKTLNGLCELDFGGDNAWIAGSYKEETNGRMRTLTYTLPSLIGVGTAQTIEFNYYNFGTTDEPDWQEYISIRTAEELQAIGNDSTSLGKNYVLMEDIDLKDITDFTPIGTDENNAFTGKFSGNGHKITNLTINKPDEDYIGLFGYSNGTIMNVGIEGGSVTGKVSVGGVCGWNNFGTISNCYNTGNVTGNDNNSYVGGVCGYNCVGTISNCYNRGTVSGSGNCVGGVCGFTTGGTIANCYFDSTVYNGNAVGYNYGTVSENVLGKKTTQFTSGEVAYLLSQGCTVGDTTYDGSVWGQEIGKDKSPVLDGKKVYLTTGECVYYTNTFYEEEQSHSYKNGICDNCGGYDPAKQNSNGEYEISNAGQLYWFAALVNGDSSVCDYDADNNPTGTKQNLSANAVLTADIDLSGMDNWTPIGNETNQYTGTFDGRNHTIKDMSITKQGNNSGLFGYIANATIKNITISGKITIIAESYTEGYGSIAGRMDNSTVINCHSSVNITITEDSAIDATKNNCIGHIGGIVGKMHEENSAISDCSYSGTIELNDRPVNVAAGIAGYAIYSAVPITNCSFTGKINCNYTDATIIGGIIGYTRSSGDVKVTNCLSLGTITKSGDTSYTGIIMGQINGGYGKNSIKNNYYISSSSLKAIGSTTGTPSTTPAVACTTDELNSGKIAYLLSQGENGSVWGQTLGTDNYPVLDSTKKVYQNLTYAGCEGNPGEPTYSYSNTEEDPVYADHTDGDEDGKCDTCSKYMDNIGARLVGHSLTLDGSVGVNFYMELSSEVISDNSAYMEFTLPGGKTSTVKVSEAPTEVISGTTYYKFKCQVNATAMTDTITAQIKSTVGNSKVYEYTVKEYADYLFEHKVENTEFAKAAELIEAMVNYGSYAQIYAGYNTEKLAVGDAKNLKSLDDVWISEYYEPSIYETKVQFAGANLSLLSTTTLRMYFQLIDVEANEVRFGYQGQLLEMKQSGDYYYVELVGIPASKLDDEFRIDVLEGSTNFVVTYTPMAYCTSVVTRPTTETRTESLKNLIKALVLYNRAADAYISGN